MKPLERKDGTAAMPAVIWLSIGILIGLLGGHALLWLMTITESRNFTDPRPPKRKRLTADQIIAEALGEPRVPRQGGRHSVPR